jgi:pantetheine-phosphate adenylyltransferase
VERAANVFDRVIVAIGRHPTKAGYFTVTERCALIAESIKHVKNASADHYDGLMIDFCRVQGARVIVRGLRAVADFESEFQMGMANKDLAPEIETVFMIPSADLQYVSSSLIREIASHGGDFARYVPAPVAKAMQKRIAEA